MTKVMIDGELVDADPALQEAMTVEEVPAPRVITFKADLWRRCTPDEADILDAVLRQAPSRMRRLFDGAQYLDPADPDYSIIRDAVFAALGEERAAIVLAPSS